MMAHQFKLDVFEGPLDLLLHLIHKNEVSLTDIPVALITAQYLEAVEVMQSLNLDVAGEYLVMAAYLVHLKSQTILPQPEPLEDDSETILEDPREELASHLLEYKRYKEAAYQLAGMPMLDRDCFVRGAADETQDHAAGSTPVELSIDDFRQALLGVIARTSRGDLLELEPERFLIREKMERILDSLEQKGQVTFGALIQDDSTRFNVLLTLLAVLELVKRRQAKVYQDGPFGTILIACSETS
jgi:segregation and condensation protein A